MPGPVTRSLPYIGTGWLRRLCCAAAGEGRRRRKPYRFRAPAGKTARAGGAREHLVAIGRVSDLDRLHLGFVWRTPSLNYLAEDRRPVLPQPALANAQALAYHSQIEDCHDCPKAPALFAQISVDQIWLAERDAADLHPSDKDRPSDGQVVVVALNLLARVDRPVHGVDESIFDVQGRTAPAERV